MKKIIHTLFGLAVVSFLISSCKKTDSGLNEPGLTGNWKYQGWSNKNCADPQLNPLGFVCTDCLEVWTETTITGSGWMDYSANYAIHGDSIIFTNSTGDMHFPEPTYSGTYVVTPTTMTITIDAPWTECQRVRSYTRL